MMPDEDVGIPDENIRLYEATRKDLFVRQLSNSEKYDNAILTLSAGILGVSLAFIKDIVPIDEAINVCILKLSWVCFSLAIVSTISSFMLSQWAISVQLTHAAEYYLEGKEESLKKRNKPAKTTDWVNVIAGILFIVGVSTTVFFVIHNLNGGNKMTEKKKVIFTQEGKQLNFIKEIKEGAPIPPMQKKIEKGAPVPNMQPIKIKPSTTTNTPKTPQDQGQGSGSQSGDKKKE